MAECSAWFGPAADGGFWALGLAVPDPALLRGVPMSVPETGRVQRERLLAAGLTVRDLPVLRDVDTAADAAAVAALVPGTRFARALAGPPGRGPRRRSGHRRGRAEPGAGRGAAAYGSKR